MASLAGVLPELALAYSQLAAAYASRGITIGIADYGGIRTQADTTEILAYRQQEYTAGVNAGAIDPARTSIDQFRPIAPFGKSFHNYGAAFDVDILARPAGMSEAQAFAIGGQLAPQFGLRWGGKFANPDTDHFELAIPLEEAQRRYSVMTGGTLFGSSGGDLSAFFTPSLDDSLAGDAGALEGTPPMLWLVAIVAAGVLLVLAAPIVTRRS